MSCWYWWCQRYYQAKTAAWKQTKSELTLGSVRVGLSSSCLFSCIFSLQCHLKPACNHDGTPLHRQVTHLVRLQAAVHMTASGAVITGTSQLYHHLLQRNIRPGVHKSEEVHYLYLLTV